MASAVTLSASVRFQSAAVIPRKGSIAAIAGIVDENVEAAETGDGRGNRPLRRPVRRQVFDDRPRPLLPPLGRDRRSPAPRLP